MLQTKVKLGTTRVREHLSLFHFEVSITLEANLNTINRFNRLRKQERIGRETGQVIRRFLLKTGRLLRRYRSKGSGLA